jgi:hypothetical protein
MVAFASNDMLCSTIPPSPCVLEERSKILDRGLVEISRSGLLDDAADANIMTVRVVLS